MRHVCVSYSAQTFGDWLRYFIALHDGFERFKLEENYGNYDLPSHYYRHELLPPRSVNLSDVFDVEYFNEKFNLSCVNNKTMRQVWKPSRDKNFNSHTIYGCSWILSRDRSYLDVDYRVIRQTDHKIIFTTLNPRSDYTEIYFERHRQQGTLGDEKIHRECFEDWWKIEYPKHKDNMPVEINKLWEGDEDYYVNMCEFLEMKPLNNWKEHIIEFNNIYDR